MSEQRLRRHHHRQRRRRRDAGRAPRPVGQAVLILERGDWLPREIENWDADEVFVKNRYVVQGHLVRRQGQGVPARASTTTSAARRSSTARRCTGSGARTSASSRHHDGISPAWPISYDELEPYYTRAEQLYEVHGTHGEDPTEPAASAPYPFPAVSHEPRIQQLSDDLERAGYHPFHAPCGVRLLEGDMPNSPCIRCATCDGFPSLVQAKSDAEIFGVRPALEHPNVTLLTNARATQADDRRGRDDGDRRRGRAGRRPRRRYRGDIVVVVGRRRQLGQAAARVGQRPPPERARQRLRPGRPATTCSTTARRCWRSRRRRTRRSSRRRSASTTSTSGCPASSTRWATSRWSASRRAPMFRGEKPLETKLAPTFTPRRGRQARRRLLAVDRGPAAPREPGHAGQGRQHHAQLHAQQPGAQEAAVQPAQVDARPPRDAPGPPDPAHDLPQERDPDRGRRPPGRDGPLRHRSGDLGPRPELQGPRAGQPVRRRHELLPEHRRREPGADGDRQLAAGRRPPAGAPRRLGRRPRSRQRGAEPALDQRAPCRPCHGDRSEVARRLRGRRSSRASPWSRSRRRARS